MNPKMPITVVALTLNEAHYIEEFLADLSSWVEEVFVVDSYSSDTTVSLALAGGARVVQRKFTGFGDQWNFALQNLPISTPWTMKLDPDERLTTQLIESIQEIIRKGDADAIRLSRRLLFMGKPVGVKQQIIRIWRTGNCHFTAVNVNEHPVVRGKVVQARGNLLHLDSPTYAHWISKQNKYSSMEGRNLYELRNSRHSTDLSAWSLSKRVFHKLPFRYTGLFFYNFVVLGAWKSGRAGWYWAHGRNFVMRTREIKAHELQIRQGSLPSCGEGFGIPDQRVSQY